MTRHPRAAALAVVAALALTGCGGSTTVSEDTQSSESASSTDSSTDSSTEQAPGAPSREELDAFVAEAEKQLNSSLGTAFEDVYSDISIEPLYPDGIAYVYTYIQPVDPDLATEQLESQIPVLRASYESQIAPELSKGLGVEDPVVAWRYLNPDGSLVFEHSEP